MTTDSFFFPRRGAYVVCVVTALMHIVVIDWVAAQLGPEQAAAERDAPPVPVRLVLARPSAPEPVAPVSAPAAPTPPPVLPGDLVTMAPSASGPSPLAPAALAAPQERAVDVLPEVQLIAPSEPAPEAPAPTSALKVNPPPSARLALDLHRVDPDGGVWYGKATMDWRRDGARYSLKVDAALRVLIASINLLTISSEGVLDQTGIAPLTATEKRKGRSATATHFDRPEARISFSASDQVLPLLEGAQDKASLPLQLAGIGRADPQQFEAGVDVQVAEEKAANVFRFVLVGREELDTKLGRLATVHLSRPPRPGSYSARLDIWLAPALHWYPVQIRNTEANGAVTTQTINQITLADVTEKSP